MYLQLRPLAIAAALSSTLLASSTSLGCPMASDVIRVGPTHAATTISSGVAAAAPGDVVLVDPGDYPEDLLVGVGVAIVADGGPAVLQGRLRITGVSEGE